MSMVRFATLCDVCEARSEEYTAFPWCRECGDDVCPEHRVSGTLHPEKNSCYCCGCWDEGAGQEEYPA
jgi:hypothetical protein